jgi:hypothetical protein
MEREVSGPFFHLFRPRTSCLSRTITEDITKAGRATDEPAAALPGLEGRGTIRTELLGPRRGAAPHGYHHHPQAD